ncbi:MAG TPA: hypothetical protein VGG42_07710 [Acidobacteriaceae bacterium]|jgi:hypothetical protein
MCLVDLNSRVAPRIRLSAGLFCLSVALLWRALMAASAAHADAVDFAQGLLMGLAITLIFSALLSGRSRRHRA